MFDYLVGKTSSSLKTVKREGKFCQRLIIGSPFSGMKEERKKKAGDFRRTCKAIPQPSNAAEVYFFNVKKPFS